MSSFQQAKLGLQGPAPTKDVDSLTIQKAVPYSQNGLSEFYFTKLSNQELNPEKKMVLGGIRIKQTLIYRCKRRYRMQKSIYVDVNYFLIM